MKTRRRSRALKDEQHLLDTVSRNARARRKALGLTNAEAAKLCGIHPRHAQKIEFEALNITLLTLAKLTTGLDISVQDLLDDKSRSVAPNQPPRPKRTRRPSPRG